jgi:ribonucleoside-diphosphate reductase alpha chain
MAVGAFVFEHFDEMSGVSFLPFDEHTYQQAPYQTCDKTEIKYVVDADGVVTDKILTHSYESMMELMPESIDWTKLSAYEKEDNTSGSQTLACSGDVCEMVDI